MPKKLGTWAWLARSLGHSPYDALERCRHSSSYKLLLALDLLSCFLSGKFEEVSCSRFGLA
jgi:hypothetical protein